MHRTVVTSEITYEALDNFRGESSACVKTVNIEEITRVLAIHGRDEFAAIKFRHPPGHRTMRS